MSRLKKIYQEQIIPALMKDLNISNKLGVPRLKKVVINVGIGKNRQTTKFTENVTNNLMAITGQKPHLRRARQAVSGFKVREGDEVGLTVTLRGEKMDDFIDKLAHITLPRIRDFRGLNPKSFDQNGNLTLGIKEQIVFPEITHEKTEILHGLEVTIVTDSGSVAASQKLLEKIGFPFKEKNG